MKTTNSNIVNPKAATAFRPLSPLTATGPKRITKNKDASKKTPHPLAKVWYACRIDANGIVKVYYDELLTAAEGAAAIAGSTMSLISKSDLKALPRKPRREQWLPQRAHGRVFAMYRKRQDDKWHDKRCHVKPKLDANRQFVMWVEIRENGEVSTLTTSESWMGWCLDGVLRSGKTQSYRVVVTVPETQTKPKPPKPLKADAKGGAK